MKKHLIVYTLTLFFFSSLHAQTSATDWYSIKGFIPDWKEAIVELTVDGKSIRKDTVHTDIYSYTGKTTGIKEAQLKITKNRKSYFISLFIEPGTIKIRDDKQQLVAFGTPTNEAYARLMEQFDSIALSQNSLRFAAIKTYKRELAIAYIKQHPHSLISIKLLADYFHLDATADDNLYFQLYDALDSTLKNSYTGRRLQPELAKRYTTAVGRVAPAIQLPDLKNELTNVYEKGKYTLLNFWASWCLPCKREHPKLAQLYNQYTAQGFTIVSISLDNNRSAWLNGVKTAKMEWRQLSDLKGFKSPAALLYGAKLIPYNLLVDPEGVIIAKNLNVEEIEQILAKKAGFTKFIGPF